MQRSRAWVCVVAIGVGGCGRSRLDVPDAEAQSSAGPGVTATGGGVGGTGGAGGNGGSGPIDCPQLRWVGEPVEVPIAGGTERVERPRVVRTSATDFGVAYALIASPQQPITIGSFAMSSPFETWPPDVGTPDVNFPSPGPYALSDGEPGEIGFVAGGFGGQLVLRGARTNPVRRHPR